VPLGRRLECLRRRVNSLLLERFRGDLQTHRQPGGRRREPHRQYERRKSAHVEHAAERLLDVGDFARRRRHAGREKHVERLERLRQIVRERRAHFLRAQVLHGRDERSRFDVAADTGQTVAVGLRSQEWLVVRRRLRNPDDLLHIVGNVGGRRKVHLENRRADPPEHIERLLERAHHVGMVAVELPRLRDSDPRAANAAT